MTERSTGPAPAWELTSRQTGRLAGLVSQAALRAARWLARPAGGLTRALRRALALRRRSLAPLGMPLFAADGVVLAPRAAPMVIVERQAAAPVASRASADVLKLLESVLLPGLVAWHQSLPASVDQRLAGELARRLLAPTGAGVHELLGEQYAAHGSLHRLISSLVEPAARRLGDLWSADHCSDAEITVGLCRLLAGLRQLDGGSRGAGHGGRAALVVPQPGEPHLLGAALDAESLWQAGWLPRSEFPDGDEALQALLAERHYDVLCISLSPAFRRSHRLGRLEKTIAGARAASLNPGLVVVVSGRAFHEDRGAARRVGADGSSRWASRFELLH